MLHWGGCVASRIIQELLEISKREGCYKVILDCNSDNVAFYDKCGLTAKDVQMVSAWHPLAARGAGLKPPLWGVGMQRLP